MKQRFGWVLYFLVLWALVAAPILLSAAACGPSVPYSVSGTPTAVTESNGDTVQFKWQLSEGPSGCNSWIQYYLDGKGNRVYTGCTAITCEGPIAIMECR